MNKIVLVSLLFLILFLFGVTCTNSHQEHKAHLIEKIKHHQTPLEYSETNADELDTAKLISVHANLPEIADFFTEKRTVAITSFPCSNCHTQTLEKMQAQSTADTRKAHWNIHLVHAEENTMNCNTCHSANNRNQLASLTGELISINESFKLCGQCHSTQYKDWQGGAHGKQLNGWKPPRVAKTCVSCHNPHQPAFPSRYPARLNIHQLGE